MTDTILTIAIPTYNRCGLLRMTLDSVMEQWVEGVEIIVSDNGSTDDTQNMMRDYCKNHNICYYRYAENYGMDKNFLNCIKKSNGKYVHLLSDDDILLPGAVEKILGIIEKEKPDYINLNSVTYSTKKYEPERKHIPRMKLVEDLVSYNKKEYMEILGVYITYISATIIKKINFERIINPEKYFGTHFLHAHLVLDMLRENTSKVVITREAYLAAKNNNSGGFNLYEVWIKQYKKLLLETAVRNGFDYSQMKNIYVKDVNGFIRDSILKYSVTENRYDMSQKWILFRYTYMYPSIWIKTYKYALLPKFILRYIYQRKRRKRC